MSNSRGFQLSAMDQLILQRKLDQEMKVELMEKSHFQTEEEKANLSQLASLVQVYCIMIDVLLVNQNQLPPLKNQRLNHLN